MALPKKPRRLTPEQIKQVTIWAGLDVPQVHMAAKLDMSKATFERCIKKQAALRDALLLGRAEYNILSRSTLYELAHGIRKKDTEGKVTRKWEVKPDMQALKLWMENCENFVSTRNVKLDANVKDTGTPPPAPVVIVQLPENGFESDGA